MNIFISILIILLLVVFLIFIFNRRFYLEFLMMANQISAEAMCSENDKITENDLKELPLPVAAYIRASGLLGKKKISSVHITHSGAFRPGVDKKFFPIKGEYFLTVLKPSFCWFGKISLIPGITISAIDTYFNGKARMKVKALSIFRIVDDSGKETAMSAFGRCIAEMTLSPAFFMDKERIKWTGYNPSRAACTVTDSGMTTDAQLYFNSDGTLDSIEVGRLFDRKNGQFSHEKFSGKGQVITDYSGLKLPSVIDGYWKLKEGDLHYVHFVIDKVEFS